MKSKQIFLFICLAFVTISQTFGQYTQTMGSGSANSEHKMNLVKLNLTAIALKNYAIQYERVLNKTISVAVSFRTMPKTSLPFKNVLLQAIDDDPETEDAIAALRLSNFAFTPEVRFYLGKGYGRGFYIAPFYRYAKFKASDVQVTYENNANQSSVMSLSGEVKANTGGLMFGAQWALSKHLALDWWILGAHYGAARGNLAGVASRPMTTQEQADLRQELADLELPFSEITSTVTANGANVNIDGPWAGIRGGITFGVRF